MAAPLILHPNRIDAATLSGGAWSAALPLANLQSRRLRLVARSAGLTKAATQLLITLPQPRRIKALALIYVNFDPTATWRIRAGTDLRTNYLLRSAAIDHAAWTKTRATVTADQALAGDGLQTLDRIIESVDNDTHEVSQDVVLAPSATRTLSVEAEANGRNLALYISDADSPTHYVRAWFNLGTGGVTSVANGGNGTGAAASIEDLGDGNYRCTLAGKPNTSGASTRATLRLLSGAGTESYTGDAASGAYAGKADLGTAPGAYVATTSAPAEGPDLALYDTGWIDVYPTVYPASAVEWADDPFMTGKPTAEDWENLIPQAIHIVTSGDVPDRGIFATHWRIELADTANPAGALDIGRVFLGGAWQPSRHMSEGAIIGTTHPTIIDGALNGAETYDAIPSRRGFGVQFDMLSRDEGFGLALELQRRAGVHKEVFFVLNPADTVHLLRTSALCRQEPVSQLSLPRGIGGNGDTEDAVPVIQLVELVA